MTTRSSVSRWARASSFGRCLAVALVMVGHSAPASRAQLRPAAPQAIIVVDMQTVLRDAAAASALRAIEAEERIALRRRLDQLTEAFRLEEEAIAREREDMAPEAFDVRVRDFDQRVRAARQDAQESSVAFQNRFAEAFGALEKEVVPVIAQLMRERGATVALDRRSVLVAADGADLTAEVIRRLDATVPSNVARDLLPPMPTPR